MICTTCELRQKDVVNVCDGQKLGCVSELEVDTDCGKVTAIIVYGDNLVSILFGRNKIRVPWERIKCIGRDTVLVELHEAERDSYEASRGKCKRC